jgi:hypothetical protein
MVRRAVAKLRDARFARIVQYTAATTGERTSVSRGQVDFATGMADVELPLPGEEGSPAEAAMVVLRPPDSYMRRPDGTWMRLGEAERGASSDSASGTLRLLESETLVATERDNDQDGRVFEVETDQGLRCTVWIGLDGHVRRIERLARGAGIAGLELHTIGQPLTFLPVPKAVISPKP